MRARAIPGALALTLVAAFAVACAGILAGGGDRTPTPFDPGASCGQERWPVKTLSDSDAGRINLTPVPASVRELTALATPRSRPRASRVPPVELRTYSLRVQVVEFKLEEDDDVHVVVADPADPNTTMIIEFPDAEKCAGADISSEAEAMRAARAALVARYGAPRTSSFKGLEGEALITGVGFFDFDHGQRGVAPNAIELHPVLRFEPITTPTVAPAPAAPP